MCVTPKNPTSSPTWDLNLHPSTSGRLGKWEFQPFRQALCYLDYVTKFDSIIICDINSTAVIDDSYELHDDKNYLTYSHLFVTNSECPGEHVLLDIITMYAALYSYKRLSVVVIWSAFPYICKYSRYFCKLFLLLYTWRMRSAVVIWWGYLYCIKNLLCWYFTDKCCTCILFFIAEKVQCKSC